MEALKGFPAVGYESKPRRGSPMANTEWTGSFVRGAALAALVKLKKGEWFATIKKGGWTYTYKNANPLLAATTAAAVAGHPTGEVDAVHYIDSATYSVSFKIPV